jgi:hypothetical protein
MGCNDLKVGNTGSNQFERTRYFSRQLITADDLTQDQDYFREKMRMHNRMLHGWGIVCGLAVTPPKEVAPSIVMISPGYALSPQGDEIYVPATIQFDLAKCVAVQSSPCFNPCGPAVTNPMDPQQPFYIAIKYEQCMSHPVRVPPVGCGCDDSVCEYSRIRDGYEVACVGKDKFPETYFELPTQSTCESVVKNKERVMPCTDCLDSPWVVLALVMPPADGSTYYNINTFVRRILLSTATMQCCCGW